MNIVLNDPKTNSIKIFTSSGTYKFKHKTSNIDKAIDEEDVILIDELSEISKTQLEEWLSLSSWFESFKKISLSEAVDKTLLFYDVPSKTIKVCDSEKGIYSINVDKASINELSDNLFGYIESCQLITKKQFIEWLEGSWVPPIKKQTKIQELKQQSPAISKNASQKKTENKEYLHTIHDGTVLIEDILMGDSYLKLEGKYHFVPVDDIGKDKIEASNFIKILLKKGKIEYVKEEYVAANKHKFKKQTSLNTTLPVGNVDDFTENDSNIITINVE